jgi:hypothetical protein
LKRLFFYPAKIGLKQHKLWLLLLITKPAQATLKEALKNS